MRTYDTQTDIVPIRQRTPMRIRWQEFRKKSKSGYYKSKFFLASRKGSLLLAFQGVCFLAVLFGISWYSIPIAIIIGGLAGIVAAERQ